MSATSNFKGRPSVMTVHDELTLIRRFLEFVDTTFDGPLALVDITEEMVAAYLATFQRRSASSRYMAAQLSALNRLSEYGGYLSDDRLAIDVLEGFRRRGTTGENTTPRIPESVMRPVLKAALFYVDVASTDIIAARAEVVALRARLDEQRPAHRATGYSRREKRRRLRAFVDARRSEGRGMPAATSRGQAFPEDADELALSIAGVNRLTGIGWGRRALRWGSADELLLRDAADELGLEPGYLTTPISADPDTGLPWRPLFSVEDVSIETSMLTTACYIVIAYLSGMRDDEVQALPTDCLDRKPGLDGRDLNIVRSQVRKGAEDAPIEEEWIVLDEVVRAVRVLQRLNGSPSGMLFSTHESRHSKLSTASTNRQLNEFRRYVNRLAAQNSSGLQPVPDVGGRPWTFSVRQFRRTVAWHIAQQRFGLVAGMIQFKHASVTTFLGYAGQSRSGFKAEIDREEALLREAHFFDRHEAYVRGERMAGPASARYHGLMQALSGPIGELPGRVANDDKQVRTLVRQRAAQLHPGVWNDCLYDPARALCQQGGAESASRPLLSVCRTGCANRMYGPQHAPVIDDAIRHAKATRRREKRTMSAVQLAAFDDGIARLEHLREQAAQAHPAAPVVAVDAAMPADGAPPPAARGAAA